MRDEELNGECCVVEGPSGVPEGTAEAQARRLDYFRDSKPDPAANIRDNGSGLLPRRISN